MSGTPTSEKYTIIKYYCGYKHPLITYPKSISVALRGKCNDPKVGMSPLEGNTTNQLTCWSMKYALAASQTLLKPQILWSKER